MPVCVLCLAVRSRRGVTGWRRGRWRLLGRNHRDGRACRANAAEHAVERASWRAKKRSRRVAPTAWNNVCADSQRPARQREPGASDPGDGHHRPALRSAGVSWRQPAPGTLVVDGRAVTYNEFVFGTFPVWDADRIEVFRSPQTTTQGQNSIAGAIFVDTNAPSTSPEYRVRGIVGRLKMREVSALMSGPIAGDTLAFRVAGDLRYARTTSKIEDVQGRRP